MRRKTLILISLLIDVLAVRAVVVADAASQPVDHGGSFLSIGTQFLSLSPQLAHASSLSWLVALSLQTLPERNLQGRSGYYG